MRLFILLTFLFCIAFTFGQKRIDVSIQDQGYTREAIISIPDKNPPAGGFPVVFMFHGTSGEAATFYNAKGWRELGEEKNFITVFPSALKWCFIEDSFTKFNTKFVNGDLVDKICPQQADKLPSDVAFAKRLVKMLDDSLPLNLKKIFATGFSNGDVMVNKLAMDAGNVFSAIAGSSGNLHELDSLANPVKRVPIWYMVGTLDDRFLIPPFTSIPYGGDSSLVYLNKIILRFIACQGLTHAYRVVESPINRTFVFDQCEIGVACQPFIFTINKGQTHQYPNGNNYPFDAPKFFWSFFNGELTAIKEPNDVPQNKTWSCYPNPSFTEMTIARLDNTEGEWSYRVMDVYGREVQVQKNIEGDHSILSLPTGAYMLQISDKNRTSTLKIVFM